MMSTLKDKLDMLTIEERYLVWSSHVRSLFDTENYAFEIDSKEFTDKFHESTGNEYVAKTNNISNVTEYKRNDTLLESANWRNDLFARTNAELTHYKMEIDDELLSCFLARMLPTSHKVIESNIQNNSSKVTAIIFDEKNKQQLFVNKKSNDCDIQCNELCRKLRERAEIMFNENEDCERIKRNELHSTFALTFCDPTVEAIEAQLMEEMTELLLTVRRENAASAELRRQAERCAIMH